jgi:hypothetical protein
MPGRQLCAYKRYGCWGRASRSAPAYPAIGKLQMLPDYKSAICYANAYVPKLEAESPPDTSKKIEFIQFFTRPVALGYSEQNGLENHAAFSFRTPKI